MTGKAACRYQNGIELRNERKRKFSPPLFTCAVSEGITTNIHSNH